MNDSISRTYAINQMQMAIKETTDPDEKEQFKRFIYFLMVLPTVKELDKHVYCTDCEHFRLDGENLSCEYSDLCNFYNPEDSDRWFNRPCYCRKRRGNR